MDATSRHVTPLTRGKQGDAPTFSPDVHPSGGGVSAPATPLADQTRTVKLSFFSPAPSVQAARQASSLAPLRATYTAYLYQTTAASLRQPGRHTRSTVAEEPKKEIRKQKKTPSYCNVGPHDARLGMKGDTSFSLHFVYPTFRRNTPSGSWPPLRLTQQLTLKHQNQTPRPAVRQSVRQVNPNKFQPESR